MLFKSLYSILKKVDALLLATALNVENSKKDNIRVVNMQDSFIKLDTQKKLEKDFVFLVEDFFLKNNIDKKTH